MSFEALLDALDAATEPSRALDCAINDAVGLDNKFEYDANYTGSLEAAFALATRFAPHGRVMVERDHAGDGWAMVQLTVNSMRSMASGKTPALALCSALLDALQTHVSATVDAASGDGAERK